MGNHFLSRRQYEMTKPISLLGHLALLVVLFAAIFDNVKVNASPMDPLKRGRSASSLIPFPRVGRSVEAEDEDSDRSDRHSRSAFNNRLLYGQKRTGKSSLIPFPRVGRSDPAWGSSARVQKRQALIPFPRTGKRASLIPFPRTGKRATPSSLIRAIPDTYNLNQQTEDQSSSGAEYPLGMENFYGGDRPSSRDYEIMQAIQNFLRELQIDN